MIVATLQLEVAQRLMAQADDDDYGMLTLLVQLDFEPQSMFQNSAGLFFPVAGRGFRVRGFGAPRAAAAAGKSARKFCENREARLLAAAEDDAEIVETGLAEGKTGSRVCRIKNLAAGTRGEIELGTIRVAHTIFEQSFMKQIVANMKIVGVKHIVVEHHLRLLYGALKTNSAKWNRLNLKIKVLKASHSAESAKKNLQNALSQSGQTHAVIVLITNCLIEALANFYLTNRCDEEQFKALERLSTLDKLVAIPKLILKEYEFPKGESLYADLKNLLDLRTSLVHSKPKVTVNDETAHKGNLSKRSSIMALTPEKCVSLPARVVAHIWNYDHGTLAELWINRDFSDSVKRENSKAKARLKQRTKK